jgi:hypothetical protein
LFSKLVSIENADKKFTSIGRAISFVNRGHAEWIEPNKRIRFIELGKQILQAQRQTEAHLLDDRGGVVFWNGDDRDPLARHEPGEIIS